MPEQPHPTAKIYINTPHGLHQRINIQKESIVEAAPSPCHKRMPETGFYFAGCILFSSTRDGPCVSQ